MKKKRVPEPIISPEILEAAKKSVEPEPVPQNGRCAVGRSTTVPLTGPQNTEDNELCWVCRRLKISAWRESEQQASLQE